MNLKEYLIVALDTSSEKEALNLVKELKDEVSFFKIGLELFTAGGPNVVKEIKNLGCKIFLDGKFLDIPNTVSKAVSNIVKLKVDMLNVHLTGGLKMLEEAKNALMETAKEINIEPPKLIGVTVLTSINEGILKDDLQINAQLSDYVLHRAKLAKEAGLDGIVCSPKEASVIRKETGKDFLIVTPGVRPSWAEKNDQQRVSTPGEAIKNGASYIVVGRPITAAKDPRDAVKRILDEIGDVKCKM